MQKKGFMGKKAFEVFKNDEIVKNNLNFRAWINDGLEEN